MNKIHTFILIVFSILSILNIGIANSQTQWVLSDQDYNCALDFTTKFQFFQQAQIVMKDGKYNFCYNVFGCILTSGTSAYINSISLSGNSYKLNFTAIEGVALKSSDFSCFQYLKTLNVAEIPIYSDVLNHPTYRLDLVQVNNIPKMYGGNRISTQVNIPSRKLELSGAAINGTDIKMSLFNTVPIVVFKEKTLANIIIDEGSNIDTLDTYITKVPDFSKNTKQMGFVFLKFDKSFDESSYPNITTIYSRSIHFQTLSLLLNFTKFAALNRISDGDLTFSGYMVNPTSIVDFTVTKFRKLNFLILGDFEINGAPPVKYDINYIDQLTFQGGRHQNWPLPDFSTFKNNASFGLIDAGSTATLPSVYNGKLSTLRFTANNMQGTLSDSYCNVFLEVSTNLLSGAIPECFRCYLNSSIISQSFQYNQFTNFNDRSECTSFKPVIKVYNNTHLHISGSSIGHAHYVDWIFYNGTFDKSIGLADYGFIDDSVILPGREYYATLRSKKTFDTIKYFTFWFKVPNDVKYTFPSIQQSPTPLNVKIVSVNNLLINGTFFSPYHGYDGVYQTATINSNLNCVVDSSTNTNFYGYSCTVQLPTNSDLQLLTMVSGGLRRRVYIKTNVVNYVNDKVCPSYCTNDNQGICNLSNGTCTCNDGFTRDDCSGIKCKTECPVNGFCNLDVGQCKCDPDWQGPNCDIPFVQCPIVDGNLCSNGGTCNNVTGECTCDGSHQGVDCNTPFIQCPNDCSGNGNCNNVTGVCTCDILHQGLNCNTTFISCPTAVNGFECSDRGTCNNVTGICTCNIEFQGVDCVLPVIQCPNDCSGLEYGNCNNITGECTCKPGRTLSDCSGIECTPKDCNNNGVCNHVNGVCECTPNVWYGEDCLKPYHYITSVIPTDTNGGDAFLYGKFIDIQDTPSVLIGELDCPILNISSNLIICSAPIGTGIKSITVVINGITYIGNDLFKYNNAIKPCPNNCSSSIDNQHTCNSTTGECNCVNDFGSFDCSTLNEPPKSVSVVDNNRGLINITNELTNFIINIKSVKEISLNGSTVNEYQLKGDKWLSSGNDSISILNQNLIGNSVVTISFNEQNGIFKLSISISNYKYSSHLNTLQLSLETMASEGESNCNNEDTKLTIVDNGSRGDDVYIQISKDSKVLTGKFDNLVLSDGRLTYFTTTSNTQPPDSIIVSLLLPHCVEECSVASSFQLLVSTDYIAECPELKSISKNWVTPVAVCVSVVAAAGLASAGFYKYKKGSNVPFKKRALTLKRRLTNSKIDLFMEDEPAQKK